MRIVSVTKYDFCNVCHVFGCTKMIEFSACLIESQPLFYICKDCAEEIAEKAKEFKNDD